MNLTSMLNVIRCGALIPDFSLMHKDKVHHLLYLTFSTSPLHKLREKPLILYLSSSATYFHRMRHKKDGFSAKGKKHSNAPRHRPTTHSEEGEAQNRRPPFKAACWDLEHCDPKRCSGKRLMHFGLMRELSVGQKFQGVVIS